MKNQISRVSKLVALSIIVSAVQLTAIVAPSFAAQANISQGSAVPWTTDLNLAINVARAQGKMVLVNVDAGWCPWCTKLNVETLTDPSVINLLSQDFVCVKLDSDSADGIKFMNMLGIQGVPAEIVIDPNKMKFVKNEGFVDAPNFISMLFTMQHQLASL